MKLFYNIKTLLLSCALLTCTSILKAQGDPTITLKGFDMLNEAGVYTHSTSSGDIKIMYSKNGTPVQRSLFLPCLGSGIIDALQLTTKGGYIDIINESDQNITHVQYVGGANSGSQSSYLFFEIGANASDLNNDEYYYGNTMGDPLINSIIRFYSDNSEACDQLPILSIPETAYKGFITFEPVNNFRNYAKHLRVTYGNGNGIVTNPASSVVTELYGIRIWLEDETPTNIASDIQESLNVTLNGSTINVSEDADISVYNLAGNAVANTSNAQQIDLTGQAKGLYIVKAKANKSGQAVVKKISLTF